MKPVFLDTVGLIATWDRSDQWHSVASPVFLRLLTSRTSLVTSSAVLLECGNAASRQAYRTGVCDLRDALRNLQCLFDPADVELERAWQTYRLGKAGTASVVDLSSFEIMRRLGITEAFTNDKHFAAAGFTLLF